ncbi:MAG TPA: response regulator [Caulobacteraceae bacterium]|jgi:signal transduction histidine kinase/CheY-like chemotaxis protein
MAKAADILEGWSRPAIVIDAKGRLSAANVLFHGTGVPVERLACLCAGERLQTADDGGGAWVWRAADLPAGERLIMADPGEMDTLDGRERYLAALSHELRTPLNGVLGMANLLTDTRLDADQRTYVQALRESGQHLLNLVNDVLDLAKLESSRIDLEPAPVDIEHLLQSVCELLSPRAREKGIEIAWASELAATPIMADEGRLRQILFNLAGNAVKYTERGGAIVEARQSQDGPGHAWLRLSVRDTGPGVPEAEQARIFEEYARASGAGARLEGAGLGLAIVRRLAAAHGGSVGLTTPPGGGSEFWFEARFQLARPMNDAITRTLKGLSVLVASPSGMVREAAARQIEISGGRTVCVSSIPRNAEGHDAVLLDRALFADGKMRLVQGAPCLVMLAPDERADIPGLRPAGFAGYLIKPLRRESLVQRIQALKASATPNGSPEDERVTPASAVGLRVLLAEDNSINAILARALLEREGCHVECAANGFEAINAARQGPHDLILMDVRMPAMDGIQASKILRAEGYTGSIVALTADAFEDDRRACMAVGMDDFLTKPLEAGALKAILAKWGARVWTRGAGEDKLVS